MEDKCDICYKIICRKCGWTASDEEAELIQKEILTECPDCGWAPRDELQV